MDSDGDVLEFDQLLDRIVTLADQLEQEGNQQALELLDYLEAWHREGITRFATAVPPEALDLAREDPVVAHLLDTYLSDDDGEDPAALIESALEEIRPYVHSHGGEMELVDVEDGVITLSLMGSCDGCPSSMVTLTQGVEGILRNRWPAFKELRVAGDDGSSKPEPTKLLQITSLKRQ